MFVGPSEKWRQRIQRSIGSILRVNRRRSGLTLSEVANISGLPYDHLRDMEEGVVQQPIREVTQLLHGYGSGLEDFQLFCIDASVQLNNDIVHPS